ncbi:hypothetical protein FYC77_13525 [Natrialba swarupiae]|uniref:Transcriptional regulator n=2 Tax=Natrialba swarupiae TaxID=2448032 RepID=A0A5D5AK42_9EURY|nr:hypothetical protein [Natrialba swarupiae]TYT61385.1 hypothetical protein FYC77_13525 [Natrialba swarupiae]
MTRSGDGIRAVERWDEVFKAVSAEPRRQIVVSVMDYPEDEPASLPEAATNPNRPADPVRLRSELRHTHLPMLSDMGFVEWESDPFVVFRGPRFEEAAAIFEAMYDSATKLPDSLVVGCRRLERERSA